MIEKINNKTVLLSFLREQPVINIYGLSYAEGYPLDDRFYKAYKCDDGYIIILDNIAFVYADLTDEVYEFLDFFGINNLYSFSLPLSEYVSTKAVILSIDDKITCRSDINFMNAVSDIEIYELLCSSFNYMPSFASYQNTRIEQRHYLKSFTVNISNDNKLVSTATVGMQNSLSGLISCVSTLKDYRKNGYGSAVVASAVNTLLGNNKIPVIISDEVDVIKLYSKLGFKIVKDLYISTKNGN